MGKAEEPLEKGQKGAASLTYAISNDSALFSALVKMSTSKFSIPVVVGPPVELHCMSTSDASTICPFNYGFDCAF